MFSVSRFRSMYTRFFRDAKDCVLRVSDGGDYANHRGVKARLSSLQEHDLVRDSSMRVTDLRAIIDAGTIPELSRQLDERDILVVDGRSYAVIHWDDQTRSVDGQLIAVEAIVRG